MHPESDESAQAKWEKRKAELVEEIQQFEHQLTEVETQMKATSHHLEWNEMPESEKFRRLAPSRKQLVDTVRMIAYRAETAMASVVREAMARGDDARSLLRDLFRSEADLLPGAGTADHASPRSSHVKPAIQSSDCTLASASQRRRVHLSGHESSARVLNRGGR